MPAHCNSGRAHTMRASTKHPHAHLQQWDCAPTQATPPPPTQVGLPLPLVRRRALFWVNHGVLRAAPAAGSSARGGAAAAAAPGRGGRAGRAPSLVASVYARASWLRPSLHGTRVCEQVCTPVRVRGPGAACVQCACALLGVRSCGHASF